MSEDTSGIKMLGRRLVVIVFAAMVALLGAKDLQHRTKAKTKGAEASHVAALLHGEVDFMKPKLAQTVDERAALRQEHPDASKKSAKETLRAWMDNLLK